MKVRNEILTGLISAAVSVLIIFGAFSMALAEGLPGTPVSKVTETAQTTGTLHAEATITSVVIASTATLTPSSTATAALTMTEGPSPTNTPIPDTATSTTIPDTATSTTIPNTATLTASITPTITQTTCPFPKGWGRYTVKDGDTLQKLADKRNTTIEKIKSGNCLTSDVLSAGMVIYLPKLPQSATATPQPATPTNVVVYCGPPAGWVLYVIKPGDTLYHISQMYSTTVYALMQANCLNSDLIIAGARLYVPNVTPLPPPLTATPTTKPSK
jgi:LysM repeat protein